MRDTKHEEMKRDVRESEGDNQIPHPSQLSPLTNKYEAT